MRRTLIIAGVAIVIIGIVSYGVWALTRPATEAAPNAPQKSFFERLFPFGAPAAPATTPGGVTSGTPVGTADRTVPRLRQVSDQPAAGAAVWKVGATSTIRYVERATGHIYETPAASPTAVRVSNTTIPGIEQVLWSNPHDFILRYLSAADAVQNFHVTLVPTSTEQALQGAFIGPFDRGVVDLGNLVTVTEGASGATVAIGKPGASMRTLLTSPLNSWAPLITSVATYLATLPGSGVPGSLYRIAGGAFVPIISSVPGLVALPSPTGKYVAYSAGSHNALQLSVIDTKTGTIYTSPLATIASKCVWVSESTPTLACGIPESLPTGDYPTDWLTGSVSLTDDIWEIEPVSGKTTLLSNPGKEAGASLDVWQPMTDGGYITFINKQDLTPWSFRIAL